ncbi:MAG: hypothetical protein KDF65_16260, partial [Anaerolineae bacterium]|nr:hypothetical protein [Anaerolineae bacterium]
MNKFRFALIGALSMAMMFVATVSAQGPTAPTGGTSGIQVVNIGTGSADLSATYYAENGQVFNLPVQTLSNPGDSYTYFAEPSSESSFSGAAIVSSNEQIAAIGNTVFSGNKGAAYGGSSAGSTSTLLPLLLRNANNQTSIISIQNTDTSASTTANVEFVSQSGTTTNKSYTIQAGASRIVDLSSESDLGTFIGSATVTPQNGTTNLVAAAMNYSNNFVYAYTGFTSVDTTYYLPLIRSGFAGFLTGIQVVDASGSGGTVSVDYSGFVDQNGNFTQDSGEAYTCSVEASVPAGQSITFFNRGDINFTTIFGGSGSATVTGGDCQSNSHANFDAAGGPFLGSAVVTGSANIAVVVNDVNTAGNSSGAYNGFLASEASNNIVSPLSRSRFANFTTGTQIQLISGSSASCVGTYKTNSASTNQT